MTSKWIVRKTVDNSGDYPFPTYDILAIHEWGPEAIACAYQNPNNANLIAAAPDMIECLIRNYRDVLRINEILEARGYHPFQNMQDEIKDIIERATGQTVEQVMEDKG